MYSAHPGGARVPILLHDSDFTVNSTGTPHKIYLCNVFSKYNKYKTTLYYCKEMFCRLLSCTQTSQLCSSWEEHANLLGFFILQEKVSSSRMSRWFQYYSTVL